VSLFDYRQSIEIAKLNPSFAAIIMAAIRQADSFNLVSLRCTFPELFEEMHQRYHAPGGILPTDPEYEEEGKENEEKDLQQGN
jgi:hypothetical protein